MKSRTLACFLAALTLATPLQDFAQTQNPKSEKSKPAQTPKPALAVINNPAPEYLSGEINILVRGDENPIIRLNMVANGQSLVEFPAKDRIFKVNPADPDLVTIEDSPTKENDRFILLRSSKQFLPQAQGSSAATSMLVQMTSGMVVTLLIFPVRELDQMVHRCVIRYDRDFIVGARQKAGLSVNLDRREGNEKPKTAATSLQYAPLSKPAELNSSPEVDQPETKVESLTPPRAQSTASNGNEGEATSSPPPTSKPTDIKSRNEAKTGCGAWERWDSGKLNWSKPQHGIKIAVQTCVIDSANRLIAVLVRNTLPVQIKLAPNQPELFIQTLDEKGKVLQFEPVKPFKVESSRPKSLIGPDEVVRYLITYEAPILGAKQRLCVAVAQINAADEPVMMELTSGMR